MKKQKGRAAAKVDRPVLEMMESSGLEVLLVDTRPLSRVPGRKTDAEDCQWRQTLHSHGLLRGAYRPSEQIGELRTIIRQKAVLVREQADWIRRMHKCLDQMNVRVHHAVSDTRGATGMAMLRAIVDGQRDPRNLATAAHGHVRQRHRTDRGVRGRDSAAHAGHHSGGTAGSSRAAPGQYREAQDDEEARSGRQT